MHPEAGYVVVGAFLTGSDQRIENSDNFDVLANSIKDVLRIVQSGDVDTVIVADGHDLEPTQLRQLSWSLQPGHQHLVMAPSLTDVAGPRIHARPVAGLPLIHVETPSYEGFDRSIKRSFDFMVAAALLLVSLPILVLMALLILTTSRGGLFFTHERIGKNGSPFGMLKFRSMVPNADCLLEEMLIVQKTSDQPLFKIRDDPRITRLGRFMRRYSLDEIPQLVNVLRGEMSLVGPRPQVAKEVALYDDAAARRLLVKPGMTGLWQVSGRSNLDWDASLRLDLYYVENWSMSYDLSIIAKTVRAVLFGDGAV